MKKHRTSLILAALTAVTASVVIATSAVFASGAGATVTTANVTTAWVPLAASDDAYAGFCISYLITSQVSAGAPAYVAAYADDQEFGGCALTLQRSANGGKTWTRVSTRSIPKTPGDATAITADVYDGPGYRARACITVPGMARQCTPPTTLGKGAGIPASPAQPVSFTLVGHGLSVGDASAWCGAGMAATTLKKQARSSVDAWVFAVRTQCVGWIEVSADKGKIWTNRSPRVVFQQPGKQGVEAFLGPDPDGTGLISRTCAQAPAISNTVICGGTW